MENSRVENINTAIYEIVSACEIEVNPFFFIVGSGISSPVVPTAKEIIMTCKEEMRNKGLFIENHKEGVDEYSYWLQKAFPHPKLRQEFFTRLIESKTITPANFKLAHLLSKGSLGKVVITPNFDDFLSRALTLFNSKYITCDNPESSFKINPERNEIQIVHVHGSYLSYDCCNLTVEINQRTDEGDMVSMLDRIGGSRSPIVIGYSGWENDVVMTFLRNRLKNPLPYNLYWFCYKESDYKSLPEWLKIHNNIVFVVPELLDPSEISDEGDYPTRLEVKKEENTLPAHLVFERLIQALDLSEPDITKDPLAFLINMINGTEEETDENDVFFLGHVIKRLKKLQVLEQQSVSSQVHYSTVQTLRGLVVSSKYDSAINLLSDVQIKLEELEDYQIVELLEVLTVAIINAENEQELIYACNFLIEVFCLAPQESLQKLRSKIVSCILRKAAVYKHFNQVKEEIETYNYILDNYSGFDDIRLEIELARAKQYKAFAYEDNEKYEEALELYQQIINDYMEEDNLELINFVCISFSRKGNIYFGLEEYGDSNAELAKLLEQYEDRKEKIIQRHISSALYNKGIIAKVLDYPEAEVLRIHNELMSRFGNEKDHLIQNNVFASMLNLAQWHYRRENYHIAINYLSEIIEKSNGSENYYGDIDNIIANTYLLMGFIYYKGKKDPSLAAKYFKESNMYGSSLAGINLAYLIRREEIDGFDEIPLESLLEDGLSENHPIAIVNLALYKVKNKWDFESWKSADELFKLLTTFDLEEIDEVIRWWGDLALNNDPEGHLVIGWLQRYGMISSRDGLSMEEHFKIAAENKEWLVHEFIYETNQSRSTL